MNTEPTVNTDEFLKVLSSELKSLPTQDLELCDLSNEIGFIIAKLTGTDQSLENEFKSGIAHGFELVSREVEVIKIRSTPS
ncbi:hypothetical protein VEZ01S_55_00130 [Vibrio ezurae NBRC 102218]|uniref:Uncharacterized protein n=1 Tax=Vibrio ezurae NBRC 102218 TaxID=1219080 RepID=U3B7A2_9VIBR|nr:hypothetical protein VEZ01S_55_00130 [Vibrio ezurae NBRC 102218]